MPRPPAPGRRGRGLLPLAVSLLANFVLAGGLVYFAVAPRARTGSPTAAGPTAAAPAGEKIEALGRVQPLGGVVSVFGPPGDRITELKVNLGDPVRKGDRLAELAGDEERRLSVAALDAQIKEADAARESIRKSRQAKLDDLEVEAKQARDKARSDIDALTAKITGLEAQLKSAQAERTRLTEIEMGSVRVSEQEKSQADLLVTQAEQGLAAARSQRQAAEYLLKTAPEATAAKRRAIEAEADRALAQVPEESLRASKKAAEQKLADAAVRAPVSGRVVKVFARPGDTLANTPVLQLADTDHMAVVAEVYETNVARLRDWIARSPGKAVQVEIDARVLGGEGTAPTLKGTATAEGIAPMIAKNTVFALGPREDTDRRVVEVEVRLDEASSRAVAGFINLQVRARFLPPK